MRLAVTAGGITGAIIGAAGLAMTIGHRITPAGLTVGALSAAALGAWMAFLASAFVGISRRAWRDAVAHQKQDHDLRGGKLQPLPEPRSSRLRGP
jgi:hypothetical protein